MLNNLIQRVYAVDPTSPFTTTPSLPLSGAQDIESLVKRLVNIGSGFIFAAAALLIIWAGFDYLSSGGDEKKLGNAKNKFIYAIIAIAIGAVAQSVPGLIKTFLGA